MVQHLTNIILNLFQCSNNLKLIETFKGFPKLFKNNKIQLILTSNVLLSILLLQMLEIKGALSGLRQSLATDIPLKLMKNAFDSTWKALFVLKTFRFLY